MENVTLDNEVQNITPISSKRKVNKDDWWCPENKDTYDYQNDPEFFDRNRSLRFNMYDGWNRLECGALVSFKLQVPCSVIPRWASKTDIEDELVDLGFDGANIDQFCNFIYFDKEIDRLLKKCGLHVSNNRGHAIFIDANDSDSNIVLYDEKYRLEVSPVRVIRALKELRGLETPGSFWEFISSYQPIDWIASFEKYDVEGVVGSSCVLSIEDIRFILSVYKELDKLSKQYFNKWCEGDYLAMLELSKRLSSQERKWRKEK